MRETFLLYLEDNNPDATLQGHLNHLNARRALNAALPL